MAGRIVHLVPPASGGVVLGTGIVSIGWSLDGHELLSHLFLGLAGAVWIGLAILLSARVVRDRARVLGEASRPPALTAVAGTAVLGTGCSLLGWDRTGIVLLAVAFCLWLLLVPNILRHWTTPTVGASFMLDVSTQSLAVLAATLSPPERAEWLAVAALVLLLLGLAAYLFVLSHFDFHQLVTGRGDHWVAGGALAIAALACGKVAVATTGFTSLHGLDGTLSLGALILWTLAIAWLPFLAIFEIVAPRPGYDLRRWSTVFPVGMYAVSSFVVGDLRGSDALIDFARIWIWVAAVLWAAVFVAMLRRGAALFAEVGANR